MSGQSDVRGVIVAGVAALGGRVIVESSAPPPATPYAMLTCLDGVPNLTLGGTGPTRFRYQVDVYDTDQDNAQAIGLAVVDAMEASALRSVLLSSQPGLYEDVVDLYRSSMDFSVWQ